MAITAIPHLAPFSRRNGLRSRLGVGIDRRGVLAVVAVLFLLVVVVVVVRQESEAVVGKGSNLTVQHGLAQGCPAQGEGVAEAFGPLDGGPGRGAGAFVYVSVLHCSVCTFGTAYWL